MRYAHLLAKSSLRPDAPRSPETLAGHLESVTRIATTLAEDWGERYLTSLGLETVPQEMNGHVVGRYVAADPTGATAVPGVWVAGNVADLRAQVISSAAAGLNTAAMLNADLIADDVRRAVAARSLAGAR